MLNDCVRASSNKTAKKAAKKAATVRQVLGVCVYFTSNLYISDSNTFPQFLFLHTPNCVHGNKPRNDPGSAIQSVEKIWQFFFTECN